MFDQDYIRFKNAKNKLLKHELIINQEIFISDIFVHPIGEQSSSRGESTYHENIYEQNYPEVSRLVDHIELISDIVNTYHQSQYCAKNTELSIKERKEVFTIKHDCLNKITRVLLSEFSLHTYIPMDMKHFPDFMRKIYKIAEAKHENMHLFLSSISFITPDENKKILNMTLYVECGKTPKITTFCKGRAHHSDEKLYRHILEGQHFDVSYFSQQEIYRKDKDGNYEKDPDTKEKILIYENSIDALNNENTTISENIVSSKGITVSNNSVFPVTTKGGAKYTQAVDTCLDNYYKHSITLFKRSLSSSSSTANINEIISSNADYILSSNTISENGVERSAFVSKFLVWNDPVELNSRPKQTVNSRLKVDDLKKHIKSKYVKTTIAKNENGFLVNNPPFGIKYTITIAQERKLSGFAKELEPLIEDKNNCTSQYYLRQFTHSPYQANEYNSLFKEYRRITLIIKNLYNSFYKQCATDFLENTFGSSTYKIKIKVKEILDESIEEMETLNKDSALFMSIFHKFLSKLRDQLQAINKNFSLPFLKDMIVELDDTIEDLLDDSPKGCLNI